MAFKKSPFNGTLVCNNLYSAQKAYEFMLNFLPEENCVFFPSDELLRAESLSSSKELLSQRLYGMGRLLENDKKILVTHPAALLRFLPNPKSFFEASFVLKKGESFDVREIKSRLSELGFVRVNKIDQSLQFAMRGDILDIFSVNYTRPLRIEFFDDVVESIRFFDIGSQSSLEEIEEVRILPSNDLYLDDDALTYFVTRLKKQLIEDSKNLPVIEKEELELNVNNALEDFVSKNYKANLYKYFGFASDKPYSILSYFNSEVTLILDKDKFDDSLDLLYQEAINYYSELRSSYLIPSHLAQYMSLEEALSNTKNVRYSQQFVSSFDDYTYGIRGIIPSGNTLSNVIVTIQSYLSNATKLVVALSEPHQKETVESLLKENSLPFEEVDGFNLPEGKIGVTSQPLSLGFECQKEGLVYLTASELFGRKGTASRFTARFKQASILKNSSELKPGDFVVHEYNGIGKFLEIKTLEVEGMHRDYLHIAYAGNESLYVPLEQFRLVRKYSGREGAAPRLSRLSSGEWTKRKAKIKERVNELADRLLTLYKERAAGTGFAFPPDDEFVKRFEDEFPFPLTSDQASSLEEIKTDMESSSIMDRLLCGDVGFGKTELAFRAAFKAIDAGKQVALLCPTTLLARQHYEVASSRFQGFGVRIAVFSRLIPAAKQKAAIKDVKDGKVHLIIGTHRLLSKSISFKDLGLLIIDEEQRFGVEQKERIKELKNNVDVLSLSATPIPRTLQMSLVGVRALSQINTAPSDRMPIQTYVAPFKKDVAFELVGRELSRNGQVYYLHNKVESIYQRAAEISKNVSGALVGVVHGQMEKDEIEDVMSRFYDGAINVLVCTSIVENGIDVANANMIIIEDADRFGLSQLYQIKGRVGRGSRIAYAYLFYKPSKNMNEDAKKRLSAIQEFTELGSGYKIAQRDLLIRGAGDMLGPEQAGFIDAIGLDLYLKMLGEAIEEKKSGKIVEPPKPSKMFDIDAYIPGGFAVNSDKIELYQELESIKSDKELQAFSKHMRDVYGRLPDNVKLLLAKKRIDLVVSNEEFSSVDETDEYVDILLSESFSRQSGIGTELFSEMVPFLPFTKVSFLERKLRIRMNKRALWLNDLEGLIKKIHELYQKRLSSVRNIV